MLARSLDLSIRITYVMEPVPFPFRNLRFRRSITWGRLRRLLGLRLWARFARGRALLRVNDKLEDSAGQEGASASSGGETPPPIDAPATSRSAGSAMRGRLRASRRYALQDEPVAGQPRRPRPEPVGR